MSTSKLALGFSLLLLLPTAVFAQSPGGIVSPKPPADANLVLSTIENILGFAFGLLLVIAALFIIYAAYLYLTSGGNEEKTKQASKVLAYAVVAIIVAFLARAIVSLTQQVIESPTSSLAPTATPVASNYAPL